MPRVFSGACIPAVTMATLRCRLAQRNTSSSRAPRGDDLYFIFQTREERGPDERRPSSGKHHVLRAITAALGCATKAQVDPRFSRSSPVCLATRALERCRSRPYYRVLPEQDGTCVVNAELERRIKVMKHLLSGVAIVAALAFAAPVWAQRTGPGVGAPGPATAVPGGPGPSSPLSNLPAGSPGIPGTPTSQYGPLSGQPAAAPPGMAPGMAPGATTSAEPPAHRHARASTHHVGLKHAPPEKFTSGGSANQLNGEELSRLQAGNFSMPPAPPGPEPSASNPSVGPGRAARQQRNQ